MVTGLVDWWGMVSGARKRRWATKHMLFQVGALAIFVVNFVARWSDRNANRADALWIALELSAPYS